MKRLVGTVCGALLIAGLASAPAIAQESDPTYPLESFGDLFDGAVQDFQDPAMAGKEPFTGDNPHYMPDWNANGTFGDADDVRLEHEDEPKEAYFRYPCIGDDGVVTYRTSTNACAPGDAKDVTFRLGKIVKLSIVDSRGMRLAGRLMLPEAAQQEGASKLPGVVFSDGAAFPASSFYLFGMTFARDGMIVLHWDQAGQGDSEGELGAQYQGTSDPPCQPIAGSCLDLQDVARWFVGQEIKPIVDLSTPDNSPFEGRRNPAYEPAGENVRNPILDRLDTTRIGLAGQSLGSVSTTSYLKLVARGTGSDGRPVPKPAAAVALSGFNPSDAVVPLQAQTADYDIPGPELGAGEFTTDGPVGGHAWYEQLRSEGKTKGYTKPLQFIVIESGSHGDSSNVTHVPHAVWGGAVGTHYATNWFGCYLKDSASACERSVQPREHLSRATASEYDIDGGAGPSPSRCMVVPDQTTLGNVTDTENFLQGLAGQPPYDCTP